MVVDTIDMFLDLNPPAEFRKVLVNFETSFRLSN